MLRYLAYTSYSARNSHQAPKGRMKPERNSWKEQSSPPLGARIFRDIAGSQSLPAHLTSTTLMRTMMRTRAPLAERGNDLYETQPVAVRALLDAEPLPHRIWEPACGPGAIVRELRAAGHDVLATDLIDYQSPDQDFANRDFLLERSLPSDIEAILTNPPFKLVNQFAEHAIKLCPKVCLLLRLAFLESKCRTPILERSPLARIYVFRERLPMMHRAGWQGRRTTNPTAYAWFIWDRAHKGPRTTHGSRRETRKRFRCTEHLWGIRWQISATACDAGQLTTCLTGTPRSPSLIRHRQRNRPPAPKTLQDRKLPRSSMRRDRDNPLVKGSA